MLSSAKSIAEIGSLQKKALRFALNDCESTYEVLLKNSGKSTMALTWQILNPSFMRDLFELWEICLNYGKQVDRHVNPIK